MLRQLALVAACGAMRPSPKRAISRRAILSWTPLVVAPANALYASETVDAAKASYEISDPSRAEAYLPLFDACGKTLGELVTNWDAIASDGDQIRRYLGTVGITSPLFKVRGALKNVLKADAPAAFDVVAFAEVSETFLAELQLAEGSAYFRGAELRKTDRGDAAAATWIFRGDESRRRRGWDVDIPWR